MSVKAFLDTNILVYTFDTDAGKRRIARDLVATALEEHNAIISSQVVQEFLNLATRKLKKSLTSAETKMYLETVMSPLCEVFPNIELLTEALNIHARTNYSYYDSLIIAAALQGNCSRLYSEDMQDGNAIAGLKIVNPFR